MPFSRNQNEHLNQAKTSLRQSVTRYSHLRRQRRTGNSQLQATLQTQLDILSSSLDKLNQNIIRIAVFGLVSRGKSAVLNALLGERLLQTGPLNGVTQWPRSVRWSVPGVRVEEPEQLDGEQPQNVLVELIDTPGLDEVAGEVRGDMAREVTRQADLILFVVSGDLTRTEYDALQTLKQVQKPVIIIFNKVDLYTEEEQDSIYQNLEKLATSDGTLSQMNSPLEIVKVAAEPAPVQVRVQWPDGRVGYEWESPPPQIEELKQTLWRIINQEGRSLLALNALVQAREAEKVIAKNSIKLQQEEAEALIWKYTKYKAIAVAINPIGVFDVVGTFFADLMLIRALSQLYGLPMTGHEATQLWKKILLSSGGMLLAEFGSGFLLGLGKSAAGLITDISTYTGIAITQASVAAYGTYIVGRAAQVYLEKGCTWGEYGLDTIIDEILSQVDRETLIARLQKELTP